MTKRKKMKDEVILGSAYLAPVEYYTKLFAYPSVYVERYDHYMKQTYRNRCVIASADGPLALTIPTEKGDDLKCLMKDIRISDHGNWRTCIGTPLWQLTSTVRSSIIMRMSSIGFLSRSMRFCSISTWNCVSGCANKLICSPG